MLKFVLPFLQAFNLGGDAPAPAPEPTVAEQQFVVETQEEQAPVAPAKVAANTPPARSPEELKAVIAKMQKVYENTTSFSANFTQRYTYTLLRRTQESSGTVQFKKPGMMRWDYKAPKAKSFVVDGKALWVHTPEDKTAMVNHCFKEDGLTASVSFLWGSGDFDKEFDMAWFPGQFGDKADHHVALTPKTPNAVYQKLILVLDAKTSRVKQSIVVDTQKNVNQFIFDNLVFNKGVNTKTFAFKAPKGTHVAPIPGTCAAPQ